MWNVLNDEMWIVGESLMRFNEEMMHRGTNR